MYIVHVNKQNIVSLESDLRNTTSLCSHTFICIFLNSIFSYIINEHTKKYYLNRLTNQCQKRTSGRKQHKPVLEHSS